MTIKEIDSKINEVNVSIQISIGVVMQDNYHTREITSPNQEIPKMFCEGQGCDRGVFSAVEIVYKILEIGEGHEGSLKCNENIGFRRQTKQCLGSLEIKVNKLS